jgi:hypothetical protein
MSQLKKPVLFILLLLGCYTASAQDGLPKTADSLYMRKRYKQAATAYFTLFAQDKIYETDANLITAAKASAKANYPDSAFRFLFTMVARGFSSIVNDITEEPLLRNLHNDKQWARLIATINKERNIFNRPVADELILLSNGRKTIDDRQKALLAVYPARSLRMKIFRDSVEKVDTLNFHKWRSIINTYSWPTLKSVHKEGMAALLYLYQHTNIRLQKIYFPMVAEAFKRGDVDGAIYAVIADKIALFDTGTQIYGTQLKQNTSDLYPVANSDSLNIRRGLVGLEPVVQ